MIEMGKKKLIAVLGAVIAAIVAISVSIIAIRNIPDTENNKNTAADFKDSSSKIVSFEVRGNLILKK